MTWTSAPIVVGVDCGDASLAALRWAVGEAAAHEVPLIAVYVLDSRDYRAPYAGLPESGADARDPMAAAAAVLAHHGVRPLQRRVEVGVPSRVLMRYAAGARMLVLGHTGHRSAQQTSEPGLGPVARDCVAHARCPVVVVPVPVGRQTGVDRADESGESGSLLTAAGVGGSDSPVPGARGADPGRRSATAVRR